MAVGTCWSADIIRILEYLLRHDTELYGQNKIAYETRLAKVKLKYSSYVLQSFNEIGLALDYCAEMKN